MIRVVVVDDEALVRSGLRLILGSAEDIDVVAACEGVQAVEQVYRHRPDVVLLDLRMPQVDGLAVLRELRRRRVRRQSRCSPRSTPMSLSPRP